MHRCKLSPESIAALNLSQLKTILGGFQKDGKSKSPPVSYEEAVRQIAEYRAEQQKA